MFIDYLRDYAKATNKTIFTTSHIIQDMERLIDDCMIMDYNRVLAYMPVKKFLNDFKEYTIELENPDLEIKVEGPIVNLERVNNKLEIYTIQVLKKSKVILIQMG